MTHDLINPADPPARQTAKLLAIAEVLMARVERETDQSGAAYAQFQRAAMLEDQVRERTRDLQRALAALNASNSALAEANRQTEAARQNLANAIETVQEGFALFDAGDVLVMCNSRFGMHMPDVQEGLVPGLSFDGYVERVSVSGHLALPVGDTAQTWAVQRKHRHRDRHVIFNVAMTGDRWVQVSEHRMPDGGTVILQTDVTDIIRLERFERGRMLDDQARLIRATLDHMDQGVCIFDAGAALVGWNVRLAALLGIPVARLLPGIGFDPLMTRLAQGLVFGFGMTAQALGAWVDGRMGRPALRFQMRRGPHLVLAVFAQDMPDGGFVLSFTDVTAERGAAEALARANETLEARVASRTLELEQALAQAERASASRSRFVAAASHDLLQPLSAAKLFIASIDSAVPARTREALDKAQNALVSVEGILEALLDISKLEGGRAAVQRVPVRLDRLLAQLRDEFAGMAAAKGLALRVRPAAVTVVSDPTYLRRILQNLIGNAIRYTRHGRVLVGARRRGGVVRLEVWDTGPGIPQGERENIFKEFHRLDAPASASEGMGLGLAIVERACALLGHPLILESSVGRGTVFRLTVPLTAAVDGPDPGQALPPAKGQGRIVFLVENDDDLRRALCLLLETWGVAVLEAATGEAALALLEELGIVPDLFIVDQQLGAGICGLDFARRVRVLHGPVATHIITADRSSDLHRDIRQAGFAVMRKPLDTARLAAIIAGMGNPGSTTIGP